MEIVNASDIAGTADLECTGCREVFRTKMPSDTYVVQHPEFSLGIVAHLQEIVCPHCQAAYMPVIAGFTPKWEIVRKQDD